MHIVLEVRKAVNSC